MNEPNLVNLSKASMDEMCRKDSTDSVFRSSFNTTANFYNNVDPGVSVRAPYTRQDYDYFRPGESIPIIRTQNDAHKLIAQCVNIYDRVGVIRSVIDLMSEFACQGIEIIHEDDIPNEFYKNWSKRVNLVDRAERFASWLYKAGNVVARRQMGTIDTESVRKLKRSRTDDKSIKPGRIPLGYEFYHPSTIELVGGSIGALSQKKVYGIKVPFKIIDGLRSPKTPLEKEVFNNLPIEIKNAIESKAIDNKTSGNLVVPIPEDLIFVGHYKKDDCDIWAKPIIYSILGDVFYNDKLKLAKTSALDSFYNLIRVWKLGDHAKGIFPNPDLSQKLASILQGNVGGGGADIIWRSDIDVQELYPPIDKLQNFEENIDAILLGLGVPQSLVGGDSKDSSGPNPIVGLRNLIMRIEAGRRLLTQWLEEEITIINRNMGFRKRPFIRFANADLHDEQTYYNLLMQLVDRNILSDQTILEKIKEVPEIERSRVVRENKDKNEDNYPDKASPFHKPDGVDQREHEIRKIRIMDKLSKDSDGMNSSNITNKKPIPNKGRPPGSRDKVSRSRRPNKSKNFAELLIIGNKVYDFVENYVKSTCLASFKCDDIRKCSNKQLSEIDNLKTLIFAQIEPDMELTEETVVNCCLDPVVDTEFKDIFSGFLKELGAEKITTEQKKLLLIQTYAKFWS